MLKACDLRRTACVIGVALMLAPAPWLARAAGAPDTPASSTEASVSPAKGAAGPGASTISREAARAKTAAGAVADPDEKAGGKTSAGKKSDDGKAPFASLGLANSHGPIDIHSDSLDLDYKGGLAVFRGHVHAVQSGTSLNSEVLKVVYGENFKEVKQVVALGHVRIDQGGRWATGERAVLNQVNQTVEMTGSPVIHDGKDQITGSRIFIYLDSEKSVVEGARGVFFPRRSETRDNDGAPHGSARSN